MAAKYQTCLLIDDNPLDTFVNIRVIKKVDFAKEIIISEFAEDALEMIRIGAIHPDVIFLDINMPVMDGFDFLKRYADIDINKKNIDIFILSSTLNSDEIRQAEHNLYVSKFLTKSLTPEVLTALSN